MAEIHWLNATSGDFNVAANWSAGVVPGAGDDVILDAAGGAYTVTQNSFPNTETIHSIDTAANATLSASYLDITDGTGAGANAGTLILGDCSFGGTLDNPGRIVVADGSAIINADTILTGGGSVVLGGTAYLGGSSEVLTLVNVDNTISGAGMIAANGPGLEFVNDFYATVNADVPPAQSGGITIGSRGMLVNEGTMESTNGGLLQIVAPIDNAGQVNARGGDVLVLMGGVNLGLMDATSGARLIIQGLLQGSVAHSPQFGEIAAYGGKVKFESATLYGGAIVTVGGGEIIVGTEGAAFDAVTIDAQTTIALRPGADLTLEGQLNNAGAIDLAGAGATTITVSGGGASLSGGGVVDLAGSAALLVGATSAAELDNQDDKIKGEGRIGAGEMVLLNDVGGTIKAVGGTLTIDTGAATIVNDGLLKVAAGASMIIASSVAGTGTLTTVGGALLAEQAVSAGAAVINGGAMRFEAAFAGTVDFTGAGTLFMAQSRSYTGAISGFSTAGANSLDLGDIGLVSAGEASFNGNLSGGVLTVSDGAHTASIQLVGYYLASSFTCASDGAGGVVVTDPPRVAPFVAAMARFGAPAAASIAAAREAWRPPSFGLAAPRAALA